MLCMCKLCVCVHEVGVCAVNGVQGIRYRVQDLGLGLGLGLGFGEGLGVRG